MRSSLGVKIFRVPKGDWVAPLPTYAHDLDAGLDLVSAENFLLEPGERRLVPTGVAVAVPERCGGFVLPRSGLASRFGVTVVNAPGLIDPGYTGEVSVPLVNLDRWVPCSIHRGDRIAQLVVQFVERVSWTEVGSVAQLGASDRGAGGFGSSGV
jgi:dUTP pyrophosphatase